MPARRSPSRGSSTAAVAAADQILAGLRRPDGRLGRSWKDGRSTRRGRPRGLRRTSPTGCSRCTRRRSTSAGSSPRASWPMRSSTTSPTPPAASSTRPTTTRRSSPARRTSRTTRVPSGASMAASVLLRLAALTGDARYRDAADGAIATVTPYLARYPTGFANWLSAAHLAVEGIDELAIVGDPADPATRALLDAGVATARGGGPEPRRRRLGRAGRVGRPAPRRSHTDRRPPDGLPVPELRLPPAGDRSRRAPGRDRARAGAVAVRGRTDGGLTRWRRSS